MTREDRIAVARRKRPLADLERAASISRRRRWGTMEGADLALARSWRHSMTMWAKSRASPPTNYCALCGQFGRMWDDHAKRYREPIVHVANCSWGVEAPEPYPGRSRG